MARTTKDCERRVPNRLGLVLLAAERAHQLWNGVEPQVPVGRITAWILQRPGHCLLWPFL